MREPTRETLRSPVFRWTIVFGVLVVAMVVAVNALAVSMVLHLRRGGTRR